MRLTPADRAKLLVAKQNFEKALEWLETVYGDLVGEDLADMTYAYFMQLCEGREDPVSSVHVLFPRLGEDEGVGAVKCA